MSTSLDAYREMKAHHKELQAAVRDWLGHEFWNRFMQKDVKDYPVRDAFWPAVEREMRGSTNGVRLLTAMGGHLGQDTVPDSHS